MIRIAAVLNNAYLGFFIPDYTAYNEMLSLFRNVSHQDPVFAIFWLTPFSKSHSLLLFPRRSQKTMATTSILIKLPKRSLVAHL